MCQRAFNRRLGEVLALLGAIAVCCLMSPSAPAQAPGGGEFETPFAEDGSPPNGWVVRQWDDVSKPSDAVWKIENGELHGGEPRGSWLMCEREFGDFELEFEFKLDDVGNSGLALRAPMKGDPAFDGMELQMADLRYNPQAKDSELTGGLYRALAPSKQVYKPTEWNKYRVELRGSRIKVVLNGETIQDADLSAYGEPVKRHDGSNAPPLKERP